MNTFPQSAVDYLKRAEALEVSANLDAALTAVDAAIRLDPVDFNGHILRGSILVRLNRFPEAVLSFNRGVQLNPGLADCIVEMLRGFRDEAVQSCEALLRTNAADFGALVRLARFRYMEGRSTESIALLERALRERPGDPNARYSLAFSQLLNGQFKEGWENYESRFDTGQSAFPVRSFSQRRWKGEDLRGDTILLYAEQGIGDTLQFIRYAPLVAERGGRVVVECPRSIKRLVETHSAVSEVSVPGEESPRFDWQIPLLSLPAIFATHLGTIPNRVPYLQVPEAGHIQLKPRIRKGPRVGLVWAGNPGLETDLSRSIPLDRFSPLWELSRVSYDSLQVGLASRQLDFLGLRGRVNDLAPELTDFGRTASAIDQLDLVISVDTAVAHLAGALGKEVWLLLPFAPEWRWLLGREDSPWYPTMRIFRQSRSDDWSEVSARVRDGLYKRAALGSSAKP